MYVLQTPSCVDNQDPRHHLLCEKNYKTKPLNSNTSKFCSERTWIGKCNPSRTLTVEKVGIFSTTVQLSQNGSWKGLVSLSSTPGVTGEGPSVVQGPQTEGAAFLLLISLQSFVAVERERINAVCVFVENDNWGNRWKTKNQLQKNLTMLRDLECKEIDKNNHILSEWYWP